MTCTCIMSQLIFLMINGNKSIIFDETRIAKGNYLSSFSMSGLLSMDFCLSHSCNTTLVAIKRTSQDDTKSYM